MSAPGSPVSVSPILLSFTDKQREEIKSKQDYTKLKQNKPKNHTHTQTQNQKPKTKNQR